MSSCVTSLGRPYGNGYRSIYDPKTKRSRTAHRLVFESFWGPIPHGCVIMHTCDNRACTNVNHLRASTQGHNLQDMVDKGRRGVRDHRTGEAHHETTLTQAQVDELRLMPYYKGFYKEMAAKLNVSRQTVRNIYTGKTWTATYQKPYLKDLL